MMARPKYGRVLTIAVTNLDDRKIARTSSLAKLDRKRAQKGSNEDWVNPHDPEAGITKMKDGRTHLAYKRRRPPDSSPLFGRTAWSRSDHGCRRDRFAPSLQSESR